MPARLWRELIGIRGAARGFDKVFAPPQVYQPQQSYERNLDGPDSDTFGDSIADDAEASPDEIAVRHPDFNHHPVYPSFVLRSPFGRPSSSCRWACASSQSHHTCLLRAPDLVVVVV